MRTFVFVAILALSAVAAVSASTCHDMAQSGKLSCPAGSVMIPEGTIACATPAECEAKCCKKEEAPESTCSGMAQSGGLVCPPGSIMKPGAIQCANAEECKEKCCEKEEHLTCGTAGFLQHKGEQQKGEQNKEQVTEQNKGDQNKGDQIKEQVTEQAGGDQAVVEEKLGELEEEAGEKEEAEGKKHSKIGALLRKLMFWKKNKERNAEIDATLKRVEELKAEAEKINSEHDKIWAHAMTLRNKLAKAVKVPWTCDAGKIRLPGHDDTRCDSIEMCNKVCCAPAPSPHTKGQGPQGPTSKTLTPE